MKEITGAQIRAARALVRLSAQELSDRAQIGIATLRRMEAADDVPSATTANIRAIRSALEAAGVEFTNGDQPGVRLRSRS